MKSFIGKTISGIGTGISSISFFRRQRDTEHTDAPTLRYELNPLSNQESRDSTESPSPIERYSTPEQDEVLYRKNNVFLKYPGKRETTPVPDATTTQVHIPGFLFITTRGSNFGSTLILNWAPNSTMRVPEYDATAVDAAAINGHTEAEMLPEDTRPSCSSVSIDLCLMEIIRIFYHTDEKGYIASGEMVISSRERDFKVFHFKYGGLSDLIQLFRSWKYFNHQHHKESHQHTFTIFRPKLSLLELHPEEGMVKSVLTREMWKNLMDQEGRVTDQRYVLKVGLEVLFACNDV